MIKINQQRIDAVIQLRIFLKWNFSKIGEAFGISTERARQIFARNYDPVKYPKF